MPAAETDRCTKVEWAPLADLQDAMLSPAAADALGMLAGSE
jgi:hypothetical protein